jgi:hypothetical protein
VNKNQLRTVGYQHLTSAKSLLEKATIRQGQSGGQPPNH